MCSLILYVTVKNLLLDVRVLVVFCIKQFSEKCDDASFAALFTGCYVLASKFNVFILQMVNYQAASCFEGSS